MAIVYACNTCNRAKQARVSFTGSSNRASEALEVVHMDTVGPMKMAAYDGSKYGVPVMDDQSSYVSVLCVKSKDEIASAVIEVLTMWERQTGRKCIRSDQRTEFQGEFGVWCKLNGVRRQYGAVYTPQQNGRAVRMNQLCLR
jgi:transposase InsO family protein